MNAGQHRLGSGGQGRCKGAGARKIEGALQFRGPEVENDDVTFVIQSRCHCQHPHPTPLDQCFIMFVGEFEGTGSSTVYCFCDISEVTLF